MTAAGSSVPARPAAASGASATPSNVDPLAALPDLSDLGDMSELGRDDHEVLGDINIISEDFLSTLTSESVALSGCAALDKLEEELMNVPNAAAGASGVGGGSASGGTSGAAAGGGQSSGPAQVCDDAQMVDVLAGWQNTADSVTRFM